MVLENLVVCHRESNHSHLVMPPLLPPLPFLTLSLSLTPLSPVLSPAPVHYFPFFFVRGGLVCGGFSFCVYVYPCVCVAAPCVRWCLCPCILVCRVSVSVYLCVCVLLLCVFVGAFVLYPCVCLLCLHVCGGVCVRVLISARACVALVSADMAAREGSRR
jgi:hypothetical protein